jgi:hypothetical protein
VSATGRGAEREPSDFYPTPLWVTQRLLLDAPHLLPPGGDWIDPCAGEGAILAATAPFYSPSTAPLYGPSTVKWTAIELRPECQKPLRRYTKQVKIGDALKLDWGRHDVCLTNPPFNLAEAFIRKSREHCRWTVMLLRLNFLGSAQRCEFLQEWLPTIAVLPNRPAFVKGKTDNCDYGWFIWSSEYRSDGRFFILNPTPLRERNQ